MKISNVSIKRPVTVTMVMLIVVIMGFVSLGSLSLDLYPEIEIPIAIVSTNYNGVGPQEIEELVTKPIEGVMGTVSGVSGIQSTSSEGSSIVILEFDFGMDIESASQEMREKLDMIRDFLPDDASSPVVFKINPNSFPIMQYSITSENGLLEAQRLVEDKISSRIERIDGVASVDITGGYENEVEILLNQSRLQGFGLSNSQVANILRSENLNLPGGEIDKGSKSLTVRTLGEYESVQEIANLPITLNTGAVIKLSDIAEVNVKAKELTSINRVNGQSSIGFSVTKQTDFNTVQVSEKVASEIKKLAEEEETLTITTVYDSSEFITSSIGNVATSGLVGGLLAVVIIYLFLRNVGSTLVIAISIPVSVIATFFMMFSANVTLNLMTLGGLALGIGMLVDNSIVVLENIYRFRDLGYSRFDAAKEGAQEVGMAVVASTLTTVAVFLPIVFVEGITSTLFKELALTVTFSLVSSLVVALTIVPMLASKLLKIDHSKDSKKRYSWFDKVFGAIENGYKKLLTRAIKHKLLTLLAAVVIFITSIITGIGLGAEFLPAMDEGRISIDIALPQGTRVEETNAFVSSVEAALVELEDVEDISVSVGSTNMAITTTTNTNVGSISIVLKESENRTKSTGVITQEIRVLLQDFTGADITVSEAQQQGMGGGMGVSPVEVSIKGDDLTVLRDLSESVADLINNVEGTAEVSSTLGEAKEELQLRVKREIAATYGLNNYTISQAVRDAVQGITATQYKVDGTEIDVTVKVDSDIEDSIHNFKNLMIQTPTGANIPLERVADVLVAKGPISIERDSQVRVVRVNAQLAGRDLATVNREIEDGLEELYFPTGYDYKIGGDYEELISSFSSLFLALVLAVVLVYMIMASQFESLVYPFIIMFSVPLAVSGGVFALKLTGNIISMPAVIGVIMLTGIVVNNGIVLVDYINTLKKKNLSAEEAVLKAGPTRLRPILMTTLTTVLGLLPMALAISEGSEATAPLALVVIGGLLLSTLLTLVLIPVMYLMLNKLTRKNKDKVTFAEE
jgi:HAE1 family hydrophobic/amphiphilic exporter-1